MKYSKAQARAIKTCLNRNLKPGKAASRLNGLRCFSKVHVTYQAVAVAYKKIYRGML